MLCHYIIPISGMGYHKFHEIFCKVIFESTCAVFEFLFAPVAAFVPLCSPQSSLFLSPVTSSEIQTLLSKLKSSCSFYWKNISNSVLKNVSEWISVSLAFIFNLVFQTGKFPSLFKDTVVMHLFKYFYSYLKPLKTIQNGLIKVTFRLREML